ncbi:MAG TPA: glycosyltransferase [Saprospiraceae bacterium]
MIVLVIALGFALAYFLLQLYYFIYWQLAPSFSSANNTVDEGVTIIVIARNEEYSIGKCLQGLLDQHYPAELFEIIVVDDHSTDNTVEVIKEMAHPQVKLYLLSDYPTYIKAPAFKKSGITLAVDKASFENIIVTDADCLHPENWLKTMTSSLLKRKLIFQTAPVLIKEGTSMIEKMQEMEQLMLMLITGSGITSRLHDLANGANMAFRKSAFLAVKGFEGNEQFASGDDMFLIEKMRKAFPEDIGFVKSLSVTIYTPGKKTWSSLFTQRLRWAGKNKGLENKSINRIWFFIGAYHAVMILSLFAALFQMISPWPFILLLCVKWTMDYMLVATSAAFFKRTSLLKYFVPLQFMYTYYVLRLGTMMIIGTRAERQKGGTAERWRE